MTNTASFEFDKWRREADERTEAEREERERRQRRAQREAAEKASTDWDMYFRGLISAEHELMVEIVGQAIGEEISDLRKELQSEMRTSLRLAILEQAGLCPHVRGTWQATENYAALDITMKDGAAWIAKYSNPGPLPGEGWQILSCKGERGKIGPQGLRGETGPPGPRGERGPVITGWEVDKKKFVVRPILDNGHGGFGPPLDLRQLFEEFADQRDGIGVDDLKAAKAAARAAERHHVFNQPPLVQLVHGPPPAPEEEGSV